VVNTVDILQAVRVYLQHASPTHEELSNVGDASDTGLTSTNSEQHWQPYDSDQSPDAAQHILTSTNDSRPNRQCRRTQRTGTCGGRKSSDIRYHVNTNYSKSHFVRILVRGGTRV